MLMSGAAIEPIENNSFKHEIDSETRVEIGDRDQSTFEPCLEWKKWDESSLKVSLMEYGGTVSQISQDRIQWRKGDVTARFYRKDRPFNVPAGNYYNPEKAFEFDIILARRPAENRIPLSIKTKDAALYPQPPVDLAQAWDYDLKAPRIVQPANIKNSIAVYHPKKRHGKYGTGKICHMPAPLITDSAARRILGRLEIMDDGRVDVVIPWDFWRLASYPVTVDPTFGEDQQGGTGVVISNWIWANFYAIPDHGAGNSMKAYLKTSSEPLVAKCNIVGPGDLSTSYLTNGETEQATLVLNYYTLKTMTFNNTPAFTKGETYGLLVWGSYAGGKTPSYSYVAADVLTGFASTMNIAYSSWPALSWGTSDYQLSLYVDYDRVATGDVSAGFSAAGPGTGFTEAAPETAFIAAAPETAFIAAAPGIAFTRD